MYLCCEVSGGGQFQRHDAGGAFAAGLQGGGMMKTPGQYALAMNLA